MITLAAGGVAVMIMAVGRWKSTYVTITPGADSAGGIT
jgi:hypothetical protein